MEAQEAEPGCFPPAVRGHDTHPGGEDELQRPVPAWVHGPGSHGLPAFQAVSIPSPGRGGLESEALLLDVGWASLGEQSVAGLLGSP